MPEDLENKGMAQRMDSIYGHSTSKQGKSKTAKIAEPSASSVTQAKSCYESSWTDSKENQKKYLLKNMQGLEPDCRKTSDSLHCKKVFDHIWHEGLWQVMRNYNFDKDLIQIIQALYTSSNSTVLVNRNHPARQEKTTRGNTGWIM